MEIAILRHGRPEAVPDARISASQFSVWIDQYNKSGIAKNSLPSKASLEYANNCGVVVSSRLNRSIQSRNLLGTENYLPPNSLFDEAGMPQAAWKMLKLPPGYWAVVFRVLWYLGYSENSESYADCKKRAATAAQKITELAETHQSVLFVGHGIFNRLLAKKLKSLGWCGPKNPGTNYWDFRIYSK